MKLIYKIYSFVGSSLIRILKIFIKPDDKLILFVSFGGKKFDDSPRAIYDVMIKDERFKEYKLVWAFHEPNKFYLDSKVKIDTIQYYIIALKARVWITNSTVERGLNFKGINTFYFNTWHGTPIKKMGVDIPLSNESFNISKQWKNIDIMTSQSNYEAGIFSRVFNIERSKFLVCGLPRNDELYQLRNEAKKDLLTKMGLPLDKKIILYAPTFREYKKDEGLNCIMKPPIDLNKWENEIGDKYIVLIRAHYEVAKVLNVTFNNKFAYDFSGYPSLNDLMLVSDLLISDYSSIFFDYSILNRPMFYFTYDYDEYEKKRGLYFDIRRELCGTSKNEEELLDLIKNSSYDINIGKVRRFREKYVESYGNATKYSLDVIINNINS